jgi:hypothetical protein
MNPYSLSALLPYFTLPEFSRFEPLSSTVSVLRTVFERDNKSDAHSTASGPPGRLTLMVVPSRLNTLSRRDGRYSVPVKRPLNMGGKAALTRLHTLQTTSLVIIGREPLREDAKAYFVPEETCKLELPFGESHDFSRVEDVNHGLAELPMSGI